MVAASPIAHTSASVVPSIFIKLRCSSVMRLDELDQINALEAQLATLPARSTVLGYLSDRSHQRIGSKTGAPYKKAKGNWRNKLNQSRHMKSIQI
jgi:hypothetical protein